ncbi:MAG: DPP IV N-terminal domain-containing protein [Bacteroidetes bacterium]|nr:DPP IV N-terminal domain-containing protein [Bacteroidota bacterium]
MPLSNKRLFFFFTVIFIHFSIIGFAQFGDRLEWSKDGNSFYTASKDGILQYYVKEHNKTLLVPNDKLVPAGQGRPLDIRSLKFSNDGQQILIFTNTKKVWRYHTRGDYWVYDLPSGNLFQLGKSLPPSSLMFAKFSPDTKKAAYVSEHNVYVEDLATHEIKQLTFDGTRKLINGTFDWVYEEEFDCRDGFRWSPNSQMIAYWQIDAKNTRDYLMLNTTDSVYSHIVPVEYPVAGQAPSPYKIGVVDIANSETKWMKIPTDAVWGSYVPRMEWAANNDELIIQHLNRKQNQSDLMLCNVINGSSKTIYTEKDAAWIDIASRWFDNYKMGGWDWLDNGKEFLWPSEKDGWLHLYRISHDGKKETLVTAGNYDVIDIKCIDEKEGYVYFLASPDNATQKYLYRTKLSGKGKLELLSPTNQRGTHEYVISPNAKLSWHSFSNYYTPPVGEWVSLPDHSALNGHHVYEAVQAADSTKSNIRFFKIKTEDGVEMDAWMARPDHFDSTKKYPVVFYVYSEPASQTVRDVYGIADNDEYKGSMAADGYIYISVDNRGTPAPKGSTWRKSIYRKIGRLNIRDQAMAAKEILKWPFVDSSRIAVWGWSGGGSATLNLMFQYPEIYKTGISIAAVGNELTYDNIYQERYMGLPQENREDFVNGSPITHAKNLQGNLLYIHGTGDDNVHYDNAEMLINELVKYNRQFQFMSYPNRTHSISEGPGTTEHLSTLYTNYLKEHCAPGAR